MEYIKNQKSAIPVVLLAGLLWSFGPLVVRYMDQPNLFPWQYIFTRGITIREIEPTLTHSPTFP